jgi:hypothetical protein
MKDHLRYIVYTLLFGSILCSCQHAFSEAKKLQNSPENIEKKPLVYKASDSEFRLSTRFRPEFFYGKNLKLLNDENDFDKLLFFRHTLDINSEYHFGHLSRGYDVILAKMNIRNRSVWGDPESIFSTVPGKIKDNNVLYGEHEHAIARLLVWIRELWVRVSLNDVFDWVPFENHHNLTIGAFPFELGRGISLGAAYSIGPETFLGYRSENSIDQYAFGLKLSGDIYEKTLSYDIYSAILDNKAGKFGNTAAKIKHNIYGHKFDPYRGFGIINYVIAGRARWKPCDTTQKRITIEPYWLYNDQREQRILFLGDARAKLGTLGVAGEFELGDFSFGFDTAHNVGKQFVRGIDRNVLKYENRQGVVTIVNSSVDQTQDSQTQKALYVPENEKIINCSLESSEENGQVIGENDLGVLTNSANRFRDPYINKLSGSMFVFDMGYYLDNPRLRINATYGFASGDENPNADISYEGASARDSEYTGFVGLQESYVGKRVRSAFMLSGAGKIPRLLSFPSEEVRNPQVHAVTRFTNVILVGTGLDIIPPCKRKWTINPNVIAFWQDNPVFLKGLPSLARPGLNTEPQNKIEDISNKHVSKFLGTEVNLFAGTEVIPDMTFWFIGAVFVPGKHFDDVKGRPLNSEQRKYLQAKTRSNIKAVRAPLLGNNTAYFINFGLNYLF